MDIQKLRKLLESLNVVFWNTTIDKQIAKEKLPNSTPIESARYRYIIASRKKRFTDSSIKKLPNGQVVDTLFKKQSDVDIPKLISPANKAKQAKTDKEISNLRKFLTCLEPCDLAFQRLQDEFTSSFAKDVLLTYKSKNTFKNFGGITVDNWMLCIELMVCMAHRDFWGTVLSDNTTYREINLAERILVIGVDKIRVNSDSVWDLIKELYSRGKLGLTTYRKNGAIDRKNAIDTLRREIGKDKLKLFIKSVKDGYVLDSNVKITKGGQVGIRKTK